MELMELIDVGRKLEANQPNQRNKTRIRTEFGGWKTFKTLEDLSDFWISSWEQWRCKKKLAGGFKPFFIFIPYVGKISHFDEYFWNGLVPNQNKQFGIFKHFSEKNGTNVVIAYPCHAYDCGCSPWAAPFLRVKTLRLGCWIWGATMPRNARVWGMNKFFVNWCFFKIIFLAMFASFFFLIPSVIFLKKWLPAPLTTIFCGLAGAPLWGGQPTKWHPWLSPRGTVGLRNVPKTESVGSVASLYDLVLGNGKWIPWCSIKVEVESFIYKKHMAPERERETDWLDWLRDCELDLFLPTFLLPKKFFKRPGDHRLPRLITATGHLPKGVSICSATFISKLLGPEHFFDSWMVWLLIPTMGEVVLSWLFVCCLCISNLL